MNTTRPYTMRTRAAGVEETRRRIMQAVFALSDELMLSEISLEAVARRAGVSVQTVLRQFGSRAGLFETCAEQAAEQVAEERRASPGDVATGLRLLVDHYERRGDATLLRLAEEPRDPVVASVVSRGRQVHRTWVTETFRPFLCDLPETAREEQTDLLVVVTDVYAWKLLRRDLRLSRTATEERLRGLVEAVLAALSSPKET